MLGSYALAFTMEPEIRTGIWGGVPDGLRPLYTLNMLLAAASFFPVTYLLGFATPISRFRELTGLSWQTLLRAYALILFPSAFWLPLTAAMIRDPGTAWWWSIRIDLLMVGIGSSMLFWMVVQRARSGSEKWAYAVIPAAFFFWHQTAVLDAIVWPAFYPL